MTAQHQVPLHLNPEWTHGQLLVDTAPELVAQVGVGTHTAAALLIAAGENSSRLRNERSFARLCGAAGSSTTYSGCANSDSTSGQPMMCRVLALNR